VDFLEASAALACVGLGLYGLMQVAVGLLGI